MRFLEDILANELDKHGRSDLMHHAVGKISFTDDGSTIYVHLLPHEDWQYRLPGRAYVLSWHEYVDKNRLDCFRWLVEEAKLNLYDHASDIADWLDGR